MPIVIPIGYNLPFNPLNLFFIHYFKLQKVEFKQMIDDVTIDL